MKSLLTQLWALAGLSVILGRASVVLFVRGWREVILPGLSMGEGAVLAGIVVLFVMGEGWMALHRKWAPRVAGLIRSMDGSTPWHLVLLAPLHVMGLLGAPRRTTLRSWLGVGAVVVAVLLVRSMSQPWQGMMKLGVAGALALGLASLLIRTLDPRPRVAREPAETPSPRTVESASIT